MIKRLFSGQINSVALAALLVAFSSLTSRFLGIFRDRILAGEFGAGDTLDIYYAAFRVPDLIFNLLVLGALSAGFIPILSGLIKDTKIAYFVSYHKSKNKEAWDLANNILNILVLSLFLISLIGIIFAPGLVSLIAPGFSPEKQALTAKLTRLMFLSPMFLGLSSVFGGILQSFKRFFVYSLSPIVYNIGIIFGALYFVPMDNMFGGVEGLAWGVVLGAFLHMTVQLPLVYKLGFRHRLKIDFKNSNVRKIFKMMVPRTLSLGISQINLLVITIIASTLQSGSLSVFNFANNLQSFPVSIFGISFAVAAFPTLSALAFDRKKLIKNFSDIFRQILFFIVPATILLLTLRAQIIRVVFGVGEFNWEDTILTMNTLAYFSISLFAQASIPLLVRMYYARHNSKTPFFIGLFSAIINIVCSLYFAPKLGIAGLALAFSIANIFNFVFLWIFLRIEIGDMDEFKILYSSLKFSIAALVSGISIQGMKLLIVDYIDMSTFLGVLSQGLFSGLIGIIIYLAICSLLKSEELFYFWNSLKRRLPWKKVEAGDQGEARGI
jgi:putative peptidoglycan lipid II flippase